MNLPTALTDARTIASQTARILLEIKAVLFNARDPFTWTSGRRSPVYVDCRKVISFPRARTALLDFAAVTVLREIGYESLDAIAGGETAGIPYAAWLADRLSLPMQYVRKQPKGFGRMAQIEGELKDGARTLLVEDLATDGGSKLKFVEALRRAGATVTDAFVIFHYGIFPQSVTSLAEIGVRLHALATWRDVLDVARAGSYFDAHTLDQVERFLADPDGWSAEAAGASA
jgi:orotate phosphoribosyltransferase